MANLYIFFDKRRANKDGQGTVKLALTHQRKTVYKTLDIHIRPDEWDASSSQVINRPDKKFLNIEIRKAFADYLAGLARVEGRRDFERLTLKQIMDMIARGADTVDEPSDLDYVVPVYNEYITLCRKTSTAQVYKSSLRNLMEYCPEIDSLTFGDINVAWLKRYQNWLINERGMTVNGANVYLRNLRSIFNYALSNQFTHAFYPFKKIDMSTTEPDKRLIAYETFVEWLSKPMPDSREFYREIFLLSYYLCGIRPVDLLNLKKENVQDGRIVYSPEKLNGRTKISIKIEPEAWEIIKKYEGENYLLNIMDNRTDYKAFCKHWNIALRAIGEDVFTQKVGRNGKKYTTVKHRGIISYITIYYARTCWASYAYNVLDIPMDIISQALGHKNGLKVTNFYVKRDVAKVDKANRDMIDRIKKDVEEWKKKNITA